MTPEELKSWRQAHNLSRVDLAEKIGVAPGTVRNWEQGARQPPAWFDAQRERLERELAEASKRPRGRPKRRRTSGRGASEEDGE